MKKKRKKVRKVIRDKETNVPKKYLSGLKGAKKVRRANLIKQVSRLYRSGAKIPLSILRRRTKGLVFLKNIYRVLKVQKEVLEQVY